MSGIELALAKARETLDRVEPEELSRCVDSGAVVVDIRPASDRAADGELPGAIVVERNVLEWRLDPTSPDRLHAATGPDTRFVIVCNEGYASSLAARALQGLGLRYATDLVGGYRAWRRLVDDHDRETRDRGND
jgi:rhodanese-related sulfurtransferase